MTKEEAKKFGLQLLHGIMERNGSYPVYANNVKQAIEALSEPDGSSEIPNDLEEAAKAYADDTNPTDSFYEAFKEGALWMREQMMMELSEKIATAYQLGLADKEKQMISALKNGGELPTEFIDKFHEIDRNAFQNGQENMKEQMMKEAIDVILNYTHQITLEGEEGFGKKGEHIKLIIVK